MDRRSSAAKTEICGTHMVRHRGGGMTRLVRIARCNDDHAGQGPHDRDVLGCMVRHAERAIREAAAHRNNLDVRVVITRTVPDLLETAKRWKVADRIDEDNAA